MATRAEMKMIASKLIEDGKFQDAFLANPEKAVASMGITFTEDQLKMIAHMIEKGETRSNEYRDEGSQGTVDFW